jgi:hypothetical protein
MIPYVSYYRILHDSTQEKVPPLKKQQACVHDYLEYGNWSQREQFTEVTKYPLRWQDMKVLKRALDYSQQHDCALIIGHFGQLKKEFEVVSPLVKSGVPIVLADFPQANELTLHIMAAFSAFERQHTANHGLMSSWRGNKSTTNLSTMMGSFDSNKHSQQAMLSELTRCGLSSDKGKRLSILQLNLLLKQWGFIQSL